MLKEGSFFSSFITKLWRNKIYLDVRLHLIKSYTFELKIIKLRFFFFFVLKKSRSFFYLVYHNIYV